MNPEISITDLDSILRNIRLLARDYHRDEVLRAAQILGAFMKDEQDVKLLQEEYLGDSITLI